MSEANEKLSEPESWVVGWVDRDDWEYRRDRNAYGTLSVYPGPEDVFDPVRVRMIADPLPDEQRPSR